MRTYLLAILILISSHVTAADLPKLDQAKIEGVWTLATIQPQGAAQPIVPAGQFTFTFKSDGTMVQDLGQSAIVWHYAVQSDKIEMSSPMHDTWVLLEATDSTLTFRNQLGIIQIRR